MMNKPTARNFTNGTLHILLLDSIHHVVFQTGHNVSET
jgi:hypothetical protein